ncbi:MAG: hypothetical protein D3926_21970 [Desulfobacteraceae bacterium]|nr:MAG: hypothetical protein D3926_21970 [Desulfobacteraceae bacterium]
MEIMVSLLILAVLMVSLFRMQASSIELARVSGFKQAAPLLAAQQISRLELGPEEPVENSGQFEGVWSGYQWQCRLSSADPGESGILSQDVSQKLIRIDLEIIGPSHADRFNLVTWRYVP